MNKTFQYIAAVVLVFLGFNWMSARASVPEILVRDLLAWLAERGFGSVEEVTATEESLLFALPPELRKDLKTAGK